MIYFANFCENEPLLQDVVTFADLYGFKTEIKDNELTINKLTILEINPRNFSAKDLNNNGIIEFELGETSGNFISAINRLDDIMYFNPITSDIFDSIFNKNVKYFIDRYDCEGITLDIDEKTLSSLKTMCFNEKNGVRYIKNKIAQKLEPYIFDSVSSGNKLVKLDNIDFNM